MGEMKKKKSRKILLFIDFEKENGQKKQKKNMAIFSSFFFVCLLCSKWTNTLCVEFFVERIYFNNKNDTKHPILLLLFSCFYSDSFFL